MADGRYCHECSVQMIMCSLVYQTPRPNQIRVPLPGITYPLSSISRYADADRLLTYVLLVRFGRQFFSARDDDRIYPECHTALPPTYLPLPVPNTYITPHTRYLPTPTACHVSTYISIGFICYYLVVLRAFLSKTFVKSFFLSELPDSEPKPAVFASLRLPCNAFLEQVHSPVHVSIPTKSRKKDAY